jgi:hypothetical protein
VDSPPLCLTLQRPVEGRRILVPSLWLVVQVRVFLVLTRATLGRMATLLLRVCLPGSDPPRVRLSERSRRSSRVDSCRLLGAVRLWFLVMWRDWCEDLCKSSTTTTAALGCWSLGARARRLLVCHRQGQADSGRGVATATRRRLVLTAVMVIQWSRNLAVISIMF